MVVRDGKIKRVMLIIWIYEKPEKHMLRAI